MDPEKVALKILEKKKFLEIENGIEILVNEIRAHWILEQCDGVLKILAIHEDANFIVKVYDLYPDGARHYMPSWGALRASHPLVESASKPWLPVHDHERPVPIVPGEIREYAIEVNPSSKVFPPGHRIQLEITAMDPSPGFRDSWTGKVANMGPVPSAKSICYRIYRDALHQSHLLMPYIPNSPAEQWVQSIE